MKITVLRKMQYEGTFIYIMQFEYVFQYLFVWKNEIYQEHIFLKPRIWRKFLWRIGWIVTPFTKDMLDQAEEVILSGAMKSIDTMNSSQDNVAKPKESKTIRLANA